MFDDLHTDIKSAEDKYDTTLKALSEYELHVMQSKDDTSDALFSINKQIEENEVCYMHIFAYPSLNALKFTCARK